MQSRLEQLGADEQGENAVPCTGPGPAAAAGLRCVVLEARDRVGGRIWTSNAWGDLPVDLGASWIHGTEGNPVYEEANRLGLATKIFDVGSFDGGGSAVYYAGNGTELDGDEVEVDSHQVIGYLENTADAQDAGRRSLRTALGDLPPRLGELYRDPVVEAAVTDYAGVLAALEAERAAHVPPALRVEWSDELKLAMCRDDQSRVAGVLRDVESGEWAGVSFTLGELGAVELVVSEHMHRATYISVS